MNLAKYSYFSIICVVKLIFSSFPSIMQMKWWWFLLHALSFCSVYRNMEQVKWGLL